MTLEDRKAQARSLFEQLPRPTEKDEAWRHTYIERFDVDTFLDISVVPLKNSESSEDGMIVCCLAEAFEKHKDLLEKYFGTLTRTDDVFHALNTAYCKQGLFVYVPKNVEVKEPVTVSVDCTGNSVVRNLIVVDSGSSCSFAESYKGEGEIMNNVVTEVFAEDNAQVTFSHVNHFADSVYSFNNTLGKVGKDAKITWNSGTFGGKINRFAIDTIFAGEGSSSENTGVFIGRAKQHIDVSTNAFHEVAHTTNDMNVKGIMMDKSTSIYRGMIDIEKEAQQTSSFLANNVLKISEEAVANSIPALEIDANDVKASHGATIGQIDDEHLFYLQSRGLSQADAEKLIVQGFLEPLIEQMDDESIQNQIRECIRV